jgi:plastocyanin
MRASILAAALAAGAATPAVAAEHVVQMENIAYAPLELRAKVGDTIRFVNADGTNHAVFVATAGHGVDLGMQKPKAETRLLLGKEGRFEVECVNHPNMRLVVVVTK